MGNSDWIDLLIFSDVQRDKAVLAIIPGWQELLENMHIWLISGAQRRMIVSINLQCEPLGLQKRYFQILTAKPSKRKVLQRSQST